MKGLSLVLHFWVHHSSILTSIAQCWKSDRHAKVRNVTISPRFGPPKIWICLDFGAPISFNSLFAAECLNANLQLASFRLYHNKGIGIQIALEFGSLSTTIFRFSILASICSGPCPSTPSAGSQPWPSWLWTETRWQPSTKTRSNTSITHSEASAWVENSWLAIARFVGLRNGFRWAFQGCQKA